MSKNEFENNIQDDIKLLQDIKDSLKLQKKCLVKINYDVVIDSLSHIMFDLIKYRDIQPLFMKHAKENKCVQDH